MKRNWKLLLAFYLPLHFAFGSFYLAGAVLGERIDCRNLCTPFDCADADTLFLYDVFGGLGLALVTTAIVLPLLIEYRERSIIETRIFE